MLRFVYTPNKHTHVLAVNSVCVIRNDVVCIGFKSVWAMQYQTFSIQCLMPMRYAYPVRIPIMNGTSRSSQQCSLISLPVQCVHCACVPCRLNGLHWVWRVAQPGRHNKNAIDKNPGEEKRSEKKKTTLHDWIYQWLIEPNIFRYLLFPANIWSFRMHVLWPMTLPVLSSSSSSAIRFFAIQFCSILQSGNVSSYSLFYLYFYFFVLSPLDL